MTAQLTTMKILLCFALALWLMQDAQSASLRMRVRRQALGSGPVQFILNFEMALDSMNSLPGASAQISQAITNMEQALISGQVNSFAPAILQPLNSQQLPAQQLTSVLRDIGAQLPRLQQDAQTLQTYVQQNALQVNNALQARLPEGLLTNVAASSPAAAQALQEGLSVLLQGLRAGSVPPAVQTAAQQLLQAINSGQFTQQIASVTQTMGPVTLTDPGSLDRVFQLLQQQSPATFASSLQTVRQYLDARASGSASGSTSGGGSAAASGTTGVVIPNDNQDFGLRRIILGILDLPRKVLQRMMGALTPPNTNTNNGFLFPPGVPIIFGNRQ